MESMRRVLIIVIVSLGVLFVADALAVSIPIPPWRQVYGTVQVRVFYAMPLKGNRTEFRDAGVQKETCVRALFPHFGYKPCWYASHKTEEWRME